MRKLSLLLLLIPMISNCQNIDTIITTSIYKSYYSYKLKEPVFVIYKLHKGGGSCDRRDFFFKIGGIKNSATIEDYSKSGYDQGHLANFEDFASDCSKAESTFRFYNAIPQTPTLNRGNWKSYETLIRSMSQDDSLLIIAGGSQYTKKIGNGVAVPKFCWKVVYSLKRKTVIFALWFRNSKVPKVSEETIESLEKKLGYSVGKYLK